MDDVASLGPEVCRREDELGPGTEDEGVDAQVSHAGGRDLLSEVGSDILPCRAFEDRDACIVEEDAPMTLGERLRAGAGGWLCGPDEEGDDGSACLRRRIKESLGSVGGRSVMCMRENKEQYMNAPSLWPSWP